MSNEELAALIQSGERDRLMELWAQVERFVAKQARRRMMVTNGFGGVEFDDLYSSGYIAMVAAVETFDPAAGGSFIGWLALHLKTAFAQSGGYRGTKQAQDPIHRAGSLDAPVKNGEDAATLGELIPDPSSLLDFERVESRYYRLQLHNALETAIEQIPPHCRDVIRRRFYGGQTLNAIAAQTGTPPDEVRRIEGEALKRLRHPRVSRLLMEYLHGEGIP